MASLKVAVIFWFMGTVMAPFAGFVAVTLGIVPVVNVHTKSAAKGFPGGFAAPVVIIAVYGVLGASNALGVKLAVVPENVTTPVTITAPGPVTRKVAAFIVAGSMA
jgi:hypothetical protein